MHHFCTQFDRNYLSRGLALHQSLLQHCPSFTLWVLCLDEFTHETLQKRSLTNVRLVALTKLEQADPELQKVKTTRSTVEYYFTCTPAFPWFLLRQERSIDVLTVLDCDLYFFSNPEPAFQEMGDNSVAITPHRFTPALAHLQPNGIYNVGWLSFRNDEIGRACLGWWRERCIEWCYDRLENGRYADQKYLDDWPTRFPKVKVLEHPGVNLAPWNVANYQLTRSADGLLVSGQPAICYHFQRVRQVTRWLYDTNLVNYKVRPTPVMIHGLYAPYLMTLRSMVAGLPTGVRYLGAWQRIRSLYKTVRSLFRGGILLIIKDSVYYAQSHS